MKTIGLIGGMSWESTALYYRQINALVKESVGLAEYSQRARTPGADFTVELKLDPEAGQLAVVPQDLSRVLLNLVDNACHALAQRRARIDREGHSGPAVVDREGRSGPAVIDPSGSTEGPTGQRHRTLLLTGLSAVLQVESSTRGLQGALAPRPY